MQSLHSVTLLQSLLQASGYKRCGGKEGTFSLMKETEKYMENYKVYDKGWDREMVSILGCT